MPGACAPAAGRFEIDAYHYLILMGACLALTAPLEVFGDGVYRQLRRTAAAILPVAAVFVLWDMLAILGDVWSYNPQYVTGFHIGVFPVEELLFFIVIPLCGLLTYSAVSNILAWVARRRSDQEVKR
jgi:lycopene cyclase domain-containing protein